MTPTVNTIAPVSPAPVGRGSMLPDSRPTAGAWDEGLFDRTIRDERPYQDLVTRMGQQQEGNCASFATIKEAMRTYGPRLFSSVQKNWRGYRVAMQDGYQVDLTRDEIRTADRAMAARGGPSRESVMGVLAFGAMAKRAVEERRHGVTDFGKALKDLNDGEVPDEVPYLLGLGPQVRPVGPQSQHFVASSQTHSVYVEAGRADHYGEAVAFDGTDTRGRLINRGFTLDATPYPSVQYRVTANPMPFRGLPAEVAAEIDKRHAEGNFVTSVQVAPGGAYVVISGRNGFLQRGVAPELAVRIAELNKEKEIIRSVALSPTGGYGIVWGRNGYLATNVPQPVLDELKRLNQAQEEIKSLALGPDGNFAILHGKNGYTAHGPTELVETLARLNKGGSTLEGVALGPNGGWVVHYDRFGYEAHDAPLELLDRLRQVHDSGARILSVFLGAEGWAVTQAPG